MGWSLHSALFGQLDVSTLYALLRLRVDVFVVEQNCPYPELDGRDSEPDTRHLWFERDGVPGACLRVLCDDGTDGPVARIGRVATAKSARGQGLAGRLLSEALASIGDRPAVLDAQSHLVGFYARYGFVSAGPLFVEDGIAHVPMCRDRTGQSSGGLRQ